MISSEYATERGRYHMRWCLRYTLAGCACGVASFYALPDKRGLIALAVSYAFYALANREHRRARQVRP